MACFLLAWEFGGGMGHVLPLAQVARPLAERGHSLHFVLRDLSGARAALGALADSPQVRLWQAPTWLLPLQGQAPALSYAELLHRAGYLDAGRLLGLAQGWTSLLDHIQPDLLLADHAPTALLAAQGRPMRRALIGNGFFQPPAQRPMPAFRDAHLATPQRLAQTEALALACCNQVLAALGRPPLAALHQLLAADENFLLTWPELDPYGDAAEGRAGARYWGPLAVPQQGAPAVWPAGTAPRLLAYLKGDYPALAGLLALLARSPCCTLAHVTGLSAQQRQQFGGARLQFSDGAVHMASALAQADAVLCHAGAGTVGASLQAGRPLLLLPMQAEQMLQAQRVQACGAGLLLKAAELDRQWPQALARLFDPAGPRHQAQALAARHTVVDSDNAAMRVALLCEALAAAGHVCRDS